MRHSLCHGSLQECVGGKDKMVSDDIALSKAIACSVAHNPKNPCPGPRPEDSMPEIIATTRLPSSSGAGKSSTLMKSGRYFASDMEC